MHVAYNLVREYWKKNIEINNYKNDAFNAWMNNQENTLELFEFFFSKFSETLLKEVNLPLAITMSNYGIIQLSSACLLKGLKEDWIRAIILKDYYNLEHSKDIEEMLEHLRTIVLKIIEISKPENIPSPSSEIVIKSIKYIAENINSPINIQEIGMAINYTPEYISHKFAKEIKIGLNEYISYKRIEQAKILLLENKAVHEVSELLSFSSNGHFIKEFKKVTGLTPKQYQLWLIKRKDNK